MDNKSRKRHLKNNKPANKRPHYVLEVQDVSQGFVVKTSQGENKNG